MTSTQRPPPLVGGSREWFEATAAEWAEMIAEALREDRDPVYTEFCGAMRAWCLREIARIDAREGAAR